MIEEQSEPIETRTSRQEQRLKLRVYASCDILDCDESCDEVCCLIFTDREKINRQSSAINSSAKLEDIAISNLIQTVGCNCDLIIATQWSNFLRQLYYDFYSLLISN